MQQKESLEQLISDIKAINGKTVNLRVVIATIESLGIREVDVNEDFGFDSIKNLAEHIYDHLERSEYINLKNTAQLDLEAKEKETILSNSYTTIRLKNFITNYSMGLFHLTPVAIQLITIILFGVSLWTYSKFNDIQSTAIALGVISGFTVTGGFLQAIGKQVSFYWFNKDYKMANASINNLLKTGIKTLLITFGLIFFINFFLHLFPYMFVAIAFMYELLIGVLLLSLAPLSTIRKRWAISLSIIIGTLVALLLFFYTNLHMYAIHWIGILTAIAIALLFLKYNLNNAIKNKENITNAYPKITLSVYRNFDYFIYGILTFVFIFTDRILAWSSTLNRNIPYLIYYEKDYEIGMDLAIIVFFLLTGVLEYSIASFTKKIDYTIRVVNFNERDLFIKSLFKSYKRHCYVFLVTGLLICILLYAIVTKPWGYEAAFNKPISLVSLRVLIIGALGYFFLTFGLFNVLHFYTLNQHKKPLYYIIIACLINIITGLIFSRVIAFEYSALGMCLGAFVFMLLTTREIIKFYKKLDYYHYAAY